MLRSDAEGKDEQESKDWDAERGSESTRVSTYGKQVLSYPLGTLISHASGLGK